MDGLDFRKLSTKKRRRRRKTHDASLIDNPARIRKIKSPLKYVVNGNDGKKSGLDTHTKKGGNNKPCDMKSIETFCSRQDKI